MSTLALSMIVRDGGAHLRACLGGARPFVQQIVVADTGSGDDSIAVAREFGARVISIPWENDFSKARNLSLAEVSTDWVLSLDADERLDPGEARRLPELMAGDAAAYQVIIRNYVLSLRERLWDQAAQPNAQTNGDCLPESARYPAYLEHRNVRLFRRHPDIYFVHRIHESVGSRVLDTGRKLGEAGFLIHHFGLALEGEARTRKNELYREMGRAKVRENPKDAQARFELGLEEFEHFGNTEEALCCFEKAAKLNPRLGVAWLFAGLSCLKLGRDAQALAHFRNARCYGHDTALIAESEGDANYNLADCPAAERAYQRALTLAPESATVQSKLGLTAVRQGRSEEGLALMLAALQRQPDAGHLYDRLVAATVSLNRLDDAALAAECKLVNVPPDPESFLRAAALRHRQGNPGRAIELLRAGVQQFPASDKLCLSLSQFQAG